MFKSFQLKLFKLTKKIRWICNFTFTV